MSQKTNPTSLRLQKSNKHFESSWYSDYFYKEMNTHDLHLRLYIQGVINQMNNSQVLLSIQNQYKRFFIYLFLQDARGIRSEREEALRVSRIPTQPPIPVLKEINNSKKAEYSVQKIEEIVFERPKSVLQNFSKTAISVQKGERLAKVDQENATIFSCSDLLLSIVKKNDLVWSSPLLHSSELGSEKVPFSYRADSFFDKQVQAFVNQTLCQSVKAGSTSVTFPKKNSNSNQSGTGVVCSNSKLLEVALMHPSKATRSWLCKDTLVKDSEQSVDRARLRINARFLSTQLPWLYSTNYVSIYPIRVIQDTQNAHFLINEIVNLIQKRVSFRQIKDQIIREILKNENQNEYGTVTPYKSRETFFPWSFAPRGFSPSSQIIKGIRISCSGRFGGRSKKAQKTKTQSVRWGETCLHVFASKLSFASKSANTSFGKVGVKVWISYAD